MFFRFGSALMLVVLISLVGTTLEKQNLELRRSVSRQQYRLEVLQETQAKYRMEVQKLGAPLRLVEQLDNLPAETPTKPPPAARTRKTKVKSAATKN